MRTNGYLLYPATRTGINLNGYGEPVPEADTAWSKPVACHISALSDSLHTRADGGERRTATYAVLLESLDNPCICGVRIVRLWRGGELLGEFPVQRVSYIRGAGRIRITV